ncbi:MAG: acido-empty-quinoprotein group A, partial [Acidobacteriia bacterium]|nr:acido-empty-quinoprotein group A [Terriglobia bacterium]
QGGGLDPADILKPLSDQWTSYSGDMSGKRYSALKQINTQTVKNLSLRWVANNITTGCGPNGTGAGGAASAGPGGAGRGGRGGGAPTATAPIVTGGFGTGDVNNCGPTRFGGGILFVDGILYGASINDVYAIDARDGSVIWHYYWKFRGGTSTGTRGPSMWHNYIFFELHDDWVVCLDARTGREVWKKEIAPFEQQYFSTNVPLVLGNHVLVGTGNDTDEPAYLKALDPETGEEQWRLYSTAQKPGDPGLESWANLEAAKHGGGTSWIPGAYDPETHLYYFGTGNPTPSYMTGNRGEGDNLYTSCLLAVNVDTGKIRNGYFFVLDRVTGENLLTSKLGLVNNYASAISPDSPLNLNKRGEPQRNPMKDALIAGALVNDDVLNYPPPTFSPDTGLFYVHEQNSLRITYLLEPDPRGSMGLGGIASGGSFSYGTFLDAIDYKTGKVKWRHELTNGSVGLTSTAGGVIFMSNGGGLEAIRATDGKPLWHSEIGQLSSPPETFLLDGKQHVLATGAAGLYMFVLN